MYAFTGYFQLKVNDMNGEGFYTSEIPAGKFKQKLEKT